MANKKLHILIITSWYPSEEQPTYGSFVEEQAQLLKRKGNRVTILQAELSGTFVQSLGKPRETVVREVYNDLTIIRVKTTPVLPKLRSASYQKLCRSTWRAIQKELKNDLPDLIHSHAMFMGGVVADYLSKNLGIPFIHTEHSSALIFQPESYTRKDLNRIKCVLSNSKMNIIVSRFFQEEISKVFRNCDNKKIIPNMVKNEFFETTLVKRNQPEHFLCIGNFIEVKQHFLLLEAWKKVIDKNLSITLTLVGVGQLEKELKELSLKLHIEDTITWKGRMSRDEILNELTKHDVILSSSKVETFGLSVAEALASGKPVVVTDSGGVRDIVTRKDGYITEKNAQALAQGILSMNENYSTFDSNDIRIRAKARFHENIIYDQLEQIYQSVSE